MAWDAYGIKKVRMDSTGSHIDSVLMESKPTFLYPGSEDVYSREIIMAMLLNDVPIYTIIEEDGRRILGAEVILYPYKGVLYITTKGNATTRDNLDNLPRF